MTTASQTALKVIVERAARPVQATHERKKRMREELLSHVTEVFEEELAVSSNEAAAVAAAERRFGDPMVVAAELQRTVPVYDRPLFAIERITAERPGESVLRRAFRWAAFVGMANAVSIGLFALPVSLASDLQTDQLSVALWLLLAIACASFCLTFVFVLLANLLAKYFFEAKSRSIAFAGLSALLSMIVPCVVAVAIYLFFSGDLQTSVDMLSVSAAWLPVIPILLFVATGKFCQERAYRREWALLPLNGT